MHNSQLNFKDLSVPLDSSMFTGMTGSFLNQTQISMNPHINVKTPKNTLQTKQQRIAESLITPQRNANKVYQIGASMTKYGPAQHMDQTANNQTIISSYSETIMKEMVMQDIIYAKNKEYGNPNYVVEVQTQNKFKKPVFLQFQKPQTRSNSQFQRSTSRQGQKQVEIVPKIPEQDLIAQRDVAKGIDYITQVTFKECYSLETQFFACTLFHRVLSNMQLKKQEIKLLAALCVFLATKHEENYGEALGTNALCTYFSDLFSTSEMLQGELKLLDSIQWRLGISSLNARSYQRCLFRDMGINQITCLLATFLAEITLLKPEFLQFRQFEIAVSTLHIAILAITESQTQKHDLTSKIMLLLSDEGNEKCKDLIVREWNDIVKNGTNTMIYKKYCEEGVFCVCKKILPIQSYRKSFEKFISTFDEKK